jgi:hypothetical protein
MLRTISFMLTLFCALTLLACEAGAQDLAPIFQLTAEETAKAKHLAQELQTAHERFVKATSAWRSFYQAYQTEHPELGNFQFTSDFRLAVARIPAGNPDVVTATTALTENEQQKLATLIRELAESRKSERQVRSEWQDYQHQLAANHVASDGQEGGTVVTLATGKTVTIPYPWSIGIAFTPDFRFAVPHY